MSDYDSQAFTATGPGEEVVISDKSPGLLRISGTFSGTVQLQVQRGNDLESTLSTDDTDWVVDSEYTEPVAKRIETPKALRFRLKMSSYTSGTANAELNGS